MTAFIGWIDSNIGTTPPSKRGQPGLCAGGLERGFVQSWTKKTTDADGTIYFVAEVSSDALIVSLLLNNEVIAGMSSLDVGLFKIDPSLPNLGGSSQTAAKYYAGASVSGLPNSTPVDAGAIFVSALNASGGYLQGSEYNAMSYIATQTVTTLGATTNGLLNYGKKVWELLGFTDPKWKDDSYAIGVRLNTAGSAAGNLVLRGRYIQG